MLTRDFISTVYVIKDKKVLLTWNKKVKNWVPVGGHIDPHELPCASVIREAKEESGLDIKLFNPYTSNENDNLDQPVNIHLDHISDDHEHINLIYFGKIVGGEFMEISDEDTPNKFFSLEELQKEDLFVNVREWAAKAIKES